MSFLVIFSCLQGLPNLLSVSSNTGDTLGPFLVSPLLWKSSWLDSTHIWSLGFLLPKRNMFCLIFSIALYYFLIPGAGPICWAGKASSCWRTGDQRSCPLPHQQASCSPARLGNSCCSPSPLMPPASLLLFLLVFPDPSCGAQGRASDHAAKGSWSELRYMDM